MSATPLLDREQALPEMTRRRWTSWLPMAIGAALGVALMGNWDEAAARRDLLLIPAFYASILVHELAHVIAGIWAGFELRGIAVGGFLLHKEAGGWRLRFVRFTGGFANMAPRYTDQLARRYTWMVLGGPAASTVLCLVLLAVPRGHFARVFLLVNLLIAAGSFIPYTVRGLSSDGRFLMILARKGDEAERLAAILYLIAIDVQGVQPGAWPREIVERIGAPAKDTPFLVASLVLKYAAARESNDPLAIANVLENALVLSGQMTSDSRRWLFASAACFQASRNRLSLAEEWMESARQVKCMVNEKDWDSKALAFIALAKGDAQAAHESLARYVALVDKRPRPLCGMLAAERAGMVALMNQPVRVMVQLPRLWLACLAISLCFAQTTAGWKEFSIGPPTRNATRTTREGITAEGIPLQRAIARAYGVPEYLVLGPGWIGGQRYAITALVTNPKDFQPLFQQELERRFHLAAHREMRDVAVYVLRPIEGVVHKLAGPSGAREGSASIGSINLPNTTVARFVGDLADLLERPVIDETGIAGKFDISLSWARGNESLVNAVKDQLGLQLMDARRSVEVLIVDHVEKLEFPAADRKLN